MGGARTPSAPLRSLGLVSPEDRGDLTAGQRRAGAGRRDGGPPVLPVVPAGKWDAEPLSRNEGLGRDLFQKNGKNIDLTGHGKLLMGRAPNGILRWMRSDRFMLSACMILGLASHAPAAAAQEESRACESFDTSGLPAVPADFLEQRLRSLLSGHRTGDRAGAGIIQSKLAQYYAQRGDQRRAGVSQNRAESCARGAGPTPGEASTNAPAAAVPPGRAAKAALVGGFYGKDGRTLHKWDFNEDGTFTHTVIAGGAGTSVRTGERGTFEVRGKTLLLTINRTATGYSTPGAGGRDTQLGAGVDDGREVRVLSLKLLGPRGSKGVVLDAVTLSPRTGW